MIWNKTTFAVMVKDVKSMSKRCEDCKHYVWRHSYCEVHDFEVHHFDWCEEFEKIKFLESEEFEIIFLLTLAVLATVMVFECLY